MRKKTQLYTSGVEGRHLQGTLKTSRGQKSGGAREMGQQIRLVDLAKDLS